MNMEKGTYEIATAKGKTSKMEEVQGYLFYYKDVLFGITNKSPDGKAHSKWTITEVTTGSSVATVDKRADAEKILEEKIDAVKEVLKRHRGE